ncbi:MAG: 50S ribosomal protein L16 [Candidatus Paceibacterota bacterium]|jgi:large subunit ribosomal protein L16
MLLPKKVKYRKSHTFRHNKDKVGVETRGTKVSFGSFGLKATSGGRIKSNEIEAARKTIAHSMSKSGKIWTRIFPDHPYTQKPAEVKMGKGKGELQGYVAIVKPGRVLFEVDGVDEVSAKEMLRKGGTKLSVDTRFVARQ